LALGDARTSLEIAQAYGFGHDYERAAIWISRAAHECDPDSPTFTGIDSTTLTGALKLHADSLLENRDWPAAAAAAEAVALIAANTDNVRLLPFSLMHLRFQADFSWAMAHLETDREAAIARLAE